MKKFLLLLVGVLFALSADAEIYLRGSFNGQDKWNSTEYAFTQLEGNTYYLDLSNKLSFTTTDQFVIYDTYTSKYHQANGNKDATVVGVEYQTWENSSNDLHMSEAVQNPYIKLDISNWKITISDKTQYSLRGDFTSDTGGLYTWDNNKYTFTPQEDGKTYIYDLSSIGELKDGQTFKIYNITNSTWYGQGAATISKDTPYTLGTGGDIKVNGAISNPVFTLVVDGSTRTLTITEQPSTPDPEPDYSGKKIVIAGFDNWNPAAESEHPLFTHQSGSIYTLALSGVTFTKGTAFKIYDITGQSTGWGTGYGPIDDNEDNKIKPSEPYTLKQSSSNSNLYVNNEIVEPQFTLDVSTWTLTISPKAVTPSTYSYRFHSNMVNGTWPADDNNDPAWKMTEQSDGTWIWQGTLAASGAFGFKRLGKDEAPSKNNTWIYGSENNESKYNITVLDQWYDAREKANSGDNSGHDWTFTPDGGTYQVIFDPAHNRTKIVKVGGINYKGRTYVISGTFNGWTAPADNTANCKFKYQETGDYARKYVWSYTGLMKNLEFKISDLSNIEEDSDKKWGKAYGYNYTAEGNVAKLTASTPGTPGTPYQLRRTNVPGEDVPVTNDELYNPTFILDPATMTLTVINNPVTSTYTYLFHSNFTKPEWSSEAMTKHDDGSWSYTCKIPNDKNFSIRQMNGDNQEHWITSNGTAAITVANPDHTKDNGSEWTTGNSAFDGKIEYTIVFTPAKDIEGNLLTDGSGTLVIYNNTAVNATIRPAKDGDDYLIVDGQKANEIVVTVPVASYLGTAAGPYFLSMGDNTIATADAVDGKVTFEYLPYLSGTREFTLSNASASKSVALNVVSPTLDGELFSLTKYTSCTLIDNLTGYADAAVACEPTATLIYDIPVWYYTINGYTYEAENVYWSTNGFSFIIKNMVAFDSTGAKEGATAYCYGTPIFPFVVREKASTLAVDASNLTIQQFGGSKVSFQVTVSPGAQVSGVEGVAVENEEAPVEYYNLQGQRVNGELAPGIYIRRQGTTVTKVRF